MFPVTFDSVFVAEGIDIIRTSYRAPQANAFAERWVRSVHHERLDKLLILRKGHLRCILMAYIDDYNHARPHQVIGQRWPVPLSDGGRDGPSERRDLLGGVLHDYYRRAA